MKIFLFDHPQNVTPEELHKDLLLLPQWRQKEAVLKLIGEGISDHLPSLFTTSSIDSVTMDTQVCLDKGFVYSVCGYLPASPLLCER